MITGYLLRQQAQDDLEFIWLYSYQEWGAEQVDKYIRLLLSRFTWLSENSQLEKRRVEIKPGYYVWISSAILIFRNHNRTHLS